MAEIKIEKKTPVWPWILLVLIILAAIYFFWYYNDRNIDGSEDITLNDTVAQVEESYRYDEVRDTSTLYTGKYGTIRKEHAFADYLGFVDNLDNKGTDRNYYRTAFFKLITATKRQAEIENVDVSNNISAAMESAEKLTNDPTITVKADNVRKAADEVSKALKTIQEKEFDNLSDYVKAVDAAVANIDGTQSTTQQASNVDVFFDKTANLLQKMYEEENNH